MTYIILDMEWNQALSKSAVIKKPLCLVGEIVQFGAVKLDDSFAMTDTFKMGVRPKYYTKMHKKVRQLTGITNEALTQWQPFSQVFAEFRAWCGDDFEFMTWGHDDIPMLRDNMLLHNIDPAWIPKCYNLQVIFDEQITKEHRQFGLAQAMELVNEQEQGAHDALHDAMGAYLVTRHLDMPQGVAEYGQSSMSKNQPGQAKGEGAITVRSRREALNDPRIHVFTCPECGQEAVCGQWLRQNPGKMIALAQCPGGEDYFVRLKFYRNPAGKLMAKRKIYVLDAQRKEYYRNRLMHADKADDTAQGENEIKM